MFHLQETEGLGGKKETKLLFSNPDSRKVSKNKHISTLILKNIESQVMSACSPLKTVKYSLSQEKREDLYISAAIATKTLQWQRQVLP